MGANEDSGKRNLKKQARLKKPFIYYYFLVILAVMVLKCPCISHDGAFRRSAVQRVPEGTGRR